jgi:hypothetical protein
LLNKSEPSDVYEELMKKEQNVLKTVNRVVNYSNENEVLSKEYLNMSLQDHTYKLFVTLKGLLNELVRVRSSQDIFKALRKDDRLFYVGVLLIIIAVFIIFIIIST